MIFCMARLLFEGMQSDQVALGIENQGHEAVFANRHLAAHHPPPVRDDAGGLDGAVARPRESPHPPRTRARHSGPAMN